MPRKDPRLDDSPQFYNERVQDRTIRHMLYLEGLKTRQARQVLEYIDNDIIPDLEAQLAIRLERVERFGFDRGAATTQRLERMIDDFKAITDRFKDVNTRIQGELFDLAIDEARFTIGMMREEAPIVLNLTLPQPETINAAIFSKPFDGRTLEQWFDRLSDSVQERLASEVRRGVTEGQTTQQIVRRVRQSGVLTQTRKQTEAVVRTALQHAATAAREEVFAANDDILKGVQWISTLDSRTCTQCASLDGKLFDNGKGIRPPAHVNCRCAISPVTKSFRELGIDVDEMDKGTRASMNGQVPKEISYNDWLKKQPIEVQEMALGKTKAKLFRDGGLDVSAFVSRNGHELTLNQIRRLEKSAFEKAGLQ